MLKVEALQAEEYLRLVSLGPSQVSMKSESSHAGSQAVSILADGSAVKNDTFRTLATDTQFKGKVKEDMLIRLLEAFIWKHNGASGRPCCWNLALMRVRYTAGELAILLCAGWVSPNMAPRRAIAEPDRDECAVGAILIRHALST